MRFADNSTILVEGINKILITRKEGKKAYMRDVLYVLYMKNNLLSLGQLLEKGYTMTMQQNLIEVYDPKHWLLLKALLSKNRTFRINLNATAIKCMSAVNVEEESWLWHYRFRHLTFKSLNMLSSKKMVYGLPSIHCPHMFCEGGVIGKQPRKMFKTAAPQRTKKPLGVVHSDVCGPFDVSSLEGNKYFLTFVDEFTKKIWPYSKLMVLESLIQKNFMNIVL